MWFEVDKDVFMAGIGTYYRGDLCGLHYGSIRIPTDGEKVFIYSDGGTASFNISYLDPEVTPDVFTVAVCDTTGSYMLMNEHLYTSIPLQVCKFPKSNFWLTDLPREFYGAYILGQDGSAHEIRDYNGVPSICFSQGKQFIPINECYGGVRIARFISFTIGVM